MNNSSRQRLLSIVAIVCFGALIGDKLLFTPLLNIWKDRSERIQELEKNLVKGQLLLDRENDLKRRWQSMKENSLPADKSSAQSQVLKSVDRWATESGITISTFKPNWKDYQENYITLDCRAAAQGNLSNVVRFLYELEKDPIAVKLEQVEISVNDDVGEHLTLSVTFSGLQILEETL
ncbi:MAG: type 4a pilus biogenesis protein PilO [Candidatus Hinthialibacter sp.]